MSINNRVDVSQVSQVQQTSSTEKASKTSTADKLQDRGTVAEQLKTKLESFKTGASDLFEKSKGNLAIGSGASLVGLGVVGAIILAPITIPGALLGAMMGAAISKLETAKEAFGGKSNIVNVGIAIGTCLTYGLGLLGAKLIAYGVNKNRIDKDNKASQPDEKIPAKPNAEGNKISDQESVPPENKIASEPQKPLLKPTLSQLEKKLVEIKNKHLEATSREHSGSLGDRIKSATSQMADWDKQINSEKESISYCNEAIRNVSEKYQGPGSEEFKDLLGSYLLTPNSKKDDFLIKLNNAAVILTSKGNVTMDDIRRDLKSVNQNMKDAADGKNLITKFTDEKSNLETEIKVLTSELKELNKTYETEVASLESQINSLKDEAVETTKPLSNEELVNRQRMEKTPYRRDVFE